MTYAKQSIRSSKAQNEHQLNSKAIISEQKQEKFITESEHRKKSQLSKFIRKKAATTNQSSSLHANLVWDLYR